MTGRGQHNRQWLSAGPCKEEVGKAGVHFECRGVRYDGGWQWKRVGIIVHAARIVWLIVSMVGVGTDCFILLRGCSFPWVQQKNGFFARCY